MSERWRPGRPRHVWVPNSFLHLAQEGAPALLMGLPELNNITVVTARYAVLHYEEDKIPPLVIVIDAEMVSQLLGHAPAGLGHRTSTTTGQGWRFACIVHANMTR